MRAITRYLKGIVGQMPMSIDAVRKAEELIKERERFSSTEWNAIASMDDDRYTFVDRERADEQLQKAIDEFVRRQIDAIDVRLRKLGVDPR